MFADVAALQEAILAREPKSFVSHFMFERVPFAFNNDRDVWIEWKHTLAELLDVDPQDIVMIGSAALGFSLNPHKNFKAFNAISDFDCGVVSSYYFDIAWRYLRQLQVSWLTLSSKQRNAITTHRRHHVFAGTIAADQMLSLLPFGSTWLTALDKIAKIHPTIGRDVKLRIYKDFDSLRYYQSTGLEKLRDQISLQETEALLSVDAYEIPIEDDNEPTG